MPQPLSAPNVPLHPPTTPLTTGLTSIICSQHPSKALPPTATAVDCRHQPFPSEIFNFFIVNMEFEPCMVASGFLCHNHLFLCMNIVVCHQRNQCFHWTHSWCLSQILCVYLSVAMDGYLVTIYSTSAVCCKTALFNICLYSILFLFGVSLDLWPLAVNCFHGLGELIWQSTEECAYLLSFVFQKHRQLLLMFQAALVIFHLLCPLVVWNLREASNDAALHEKCVHWE